MPVFGPAALIMIVGTKPGSEDAFSEWHAREHIIERLGLPGFRRGRRAISTDAPDANRFLVIYEADAPEVFESTAYLERLNNPTPWSREIGQNHFAGLKRTVCRLIAGDGVGVGGWCGVLLLSVSPQDLSTELTELCERPGITGAFALEGTSAGQQETTEKDARGGKDDTFAGAVLIEGVEELAVRLATEELATRLKPKLTEIYTLQHLLAPS